MTIMRINSIDITRGFVMVIMALDHVREFFHASAMTTSPTDLETTTTALFFTRWVTHLCAPAFVFLAGASAYISLKRLNNVRESSGFLLKRGIWLVVLEFTLINFALWFDIRFRLIILEVIAAIGLSFIVLSVILRLNSRIIGIAGIIIIFTHNLLQGVPLPANPASEAIFSVLFRPNLLPVIPGFSFFTAYPLIPWLGIMLIGFGCGELFMMPAEKRKSIFLKLGLAFILLFAAIRFSNFYGDPSRWSEQRSGWFGLLSFINVTKYPPSLLFSLLFTGLTLIVLFICEKAGNRITRFLEIYGKVPFFFFIVHLYLIHALMFVMLFIQGYGLEDLSFGVFKNGRPETGGGVGLAVVYLVWAGVVAALYPICKWYGDYKAAHREKKILAYL
jgi:uncharacterized membrane protein